MLRTSVCLLAGICALSVALDAQAVTFSEVARFDLFDGSADQQATTFIGSNPSAVAWDRGQLYVAGFNNSGAAADTGIVEVTNAGATGLVFAALSDAFGEVAGTPVSRGYSGLDLVDGVLAAAHDPGSAFPNGIQAFDAGTNTLTWAKNARGGSGVGHDPGFSGVDSGVAWLTFGSGRRPLQDTTTGADIYTTGDGMIVTDFGGSFWRDLDFDASTGDLYARRANDVLKTTRTGGNSGAVSVIVDTNENAPFVNGQNIDFMATSEFGDLVIYNDRTGGGSGQSFASVVNVIDSSGAAVPASFLSLTGGFADGNGYYDFDFDAASQTLAVLDFNNRNVHIFQVVPEPSAAVLTLVAGLGLAVRRR